MAGTGSIGCISTCDGTDGGSTTCVGEVVLNLLPSVTRSSRVSSSGTPRGSPVTSPRVLPKVSTTVLPASGPRAPSVANPRASGVVASGSPLRGIDLLEQVTVVQMDHLDPSALGLQTSSFGPVVAPSWRNVVANGVGLQEGAGSVISPEKMKLDYIPRYCK